jgi:hypothetical protein
MSIELVIPFAIDIAVEDDDTDKQMMLLMMLLF